MNHLSVIANARLKHVLEWFLMDLLGYQAFFKAKAEWVKTHADICILGSVLCLHNR